MTNSIFRIHRWTAEDKAFNQNREVWNEGPALWGPVFDIFHPVVDIDGDLYGCKVATPSGEHPTDLFDKVGKMLTRRSPFSLVEWESVVSNGCEHFYIIATEKDQTFLCNEKQLDSTQFSVAHWICLEIAQNLMSLHAFLWERSVSCSYRCWWSGAECWTNAFTVCSHVLISKGRKGSSLNSVIWQMQVDGSGDYSVCSQIHREEANARWTERDSTGFWVGGLRDPRLGSWLPFAYRFN